MGATEQPGEQAKFSRTQGEGCCVFLAPQPAESILVLLGLSCRFREAVSYWGLFPSLNLTWALYIPVLSQAVQWGGQSSTELGRHQGSSLVLPRQDLCPSLQVGEDAGWCPWEQI